ncbi:hypothetical protein FIBSPDRAFT_878937 [Athelia psychrophila]|uniref:Uncharacterized protein n=1 Tax=Athelia psychrophila TaxID=1759441 RepID=A0A167UJN3_9AGAM|nr:hypothetical protein FIBSPDRAFT_878937 [Fibularhizoctonia sp. CBS 109695]
MDDQDDFPAFNFLITGFQRAIDDVSHNDGMRKSTPRPQPMTKATARCLGELFVPRQGPWRGRGGSECLYGCPRSVTSQPWLRLGARVELGLELRSAESSETSVISEFQAGRSGTGARPPRPSICSPYREGLARIAVFVLAYDSDILYVSGYKTGRRP